MRYWMLFAITVATACSENRERSDPQQVRADSAADGAVRAPLDTVQLTPDSTMARDTAAL